MIVTQKEINTDSGQKTFKVIRLPDSNRGRKNKALAFSARAFAGSIKRRPHAAHLSSKPRSL